MPELTAQQDQNLVFVKTSLVDTIYTALAPSLDFGYGFSRTTIQNAVMQAFDKSLSHEQIIDAILPMLYLDTLSNDNSFVSVADYIKSILCCFFNHEINDFQQDRDISQLNRSGLTAQLTLQRQAFESASKKRLGGGFAHLNLELATNLAAALNFEVDLYELDILLSKLLEDEGELFCYNFGLSKIYMHQRLSNIIYSALLSTGACTMVDPEKIKTSISNVVRNTKSLYGPQVQSPVKPAQQTLYEVVTLNSEQLKEFSILFANDNNKLADNLLIALNNRGFCLTLDSVQSALHTALSTFNNPAVFCQRMNRQDGSTLLEFSQQLCKGLMLEDSGQQFLATSIISNKLVRLTHQHHPAKAILAKVNSSKRTDDVRKMLESFHSSMTLTEMLIIFDRLNQNESKLGLNTHRNPTLDKLLGRKDTYSWTLVRDNMQKAAMAQFEKEYHAPTLGTQGQRDLLNRAITSPLFNQHSQYSFFQKASGPIAALAKMQQELPLRFDSL